MVDRLCHSEANARRIATVENCFGASGQPLAIQGRALVGEGVLTKMCRKKAKPRQFFLFNDILVYGNIVMDKKKYNKQHIIPLEEVKLEDLDDDGALKNGFLIRTPTKSFAVYAATATEKTEWMVHINKCVDDLLKKTGKKPSLEHAAVWIPDAEASICMHCRKTQFNLINRRHHCRKCGAVVCNACSSKKFLLPAQSSKPLRVCLSCYNTLSKASGASGSRPAAADFPSKPSTSMGEKPTNPESSGEDDSEDDDEPKDEGAVLGAVGNLTIDDKPTFYGDAVEDNIASLYGQGDIPQADVVVEQPRGAAVAPPPVVAVEPPLVVAVPPVLPEEPPAREVVETSVECACYAQGDIGSLPVQDVPRPYFGQEDGEDHGGEGSRDRTGEGSRDRTDDDDDAPNEEN